MSEDRYSESQRDYDVVLVSGKSHHVESTPEDEAYGMEPYTVEHGYLSSDFLVRLDKPDTLLYYLESMLPKYNAELGTIQHVLGLIFTGVTLVVTAVATLLLGFEWWSLLLAVLAAAAMFVWRFFLRDYFWALFAGLRGSLFVLRRVLFESQSLKHYKVLTQHLAQSDDSDVVRVNKIINTLILA